MRIRNFIIADAISPGPQGKMFVHGGGVTQIGAFEFPFVQARLGLLVTLVYESPEDDIEQHIEIVVMNDDGTEIAKVLDLKAAKPPEAFEERNSWRLLHVMGDVAGLRFEDPGRYWMVLKLNGSEIDRVLLDVELLGPHPLPPSEPDS